MMEASRPGRNAEGLPERATYSTISARCISKSWTVLSILSSSARSAGNPPVRQPSLGAGSSLLASAGPEAAGALFTVETELDIILAVRVVADLADAHQSANRIRRR